MDELGYGPDYCGAIKKKVTRNATCEAQAVNWYRSALQRTLAGKQRKAEQAEAETTPFRNMLKIEGQEFFMPVLVRPWSSPGHEPGTYRPFEEIQIADLLGVAASLGFTPVYQTAEALRREHPVAGELFFTNDTRLFPTICRRWLCEYRPASSIGYVPVYATLRVLQTDFPHTPYTKARLNLEEFRMPLPGSAVPDVTRDLEARTISGKEFAALMFTPGVKITLLEPVTLSPDTCQNEPEL